MAGFEVIVRPVVFPNIRPAPARSILPEDDPEQGVAVLGGSGGKLVDLTSSESGNISRSHLVESKRRFDKVKIPYTRPDGTFDYSRYTVVEVLRKVDFFSGNEDTSHTYARFEVPADDSARVIERDVVRKNPQA